MIFREQAYNLWTQEKEIEDGFHLSVGGLLGWIMNQDKVLHPTQFSNFNIFQ